MAYQSPADILNRALQILALPFVGTLADQALGAVAGNFTYDKVREFELQRNMWTFSTRRCILRPLSTTSAAITFPTYAAGTTYRGGAVVLFGGVLWYSLIDGNVGNTPGTFPTTGALPWDRYFGTRVAQAWNEAAGVVTIGAPGENVSYGAGEIVYKTPGDGTYAIYHSLVQGNGNQPDAVDLWNPTLMYSAGDVASFNGVNYQSRVNLNLNWEPDVSSTQWTSTITSPLTSRSWLLIATTGLSTLPITYPLTAGPAQDPITRNAYPLPAGHLKPCPDAPKEGLIPWLGAPTGVEHRDWDYEGGYIVSSSTQPIMTRFIANITDVTKFHPMFCEGLAAAIAVGIAPALVDPTGVSAQTGKALRYYNSVMRDARTQNAIEIGSITPPDDTYIAVRY